MVKLTITETIEKAIQECKKRPRWSAEVSLPTEPSLDHAAIGDPISHSQIIGISRLLKSCSSAAVDSDAAVYSLERLLKGSRIYVEPPPTKPEPTSEYKALMARLRREEEASAYERMINPPLPLETFEQRYPNTAGSKLFGTARVTDDDEVTYADVNRQMAVIINVLLSIVACSVALWLASRHWSTPRRLGLSMGGSGLVAIAEVVVYLGYLRRITEAKIKTKKHVEVQEIINTWEIGSRKTDSKPETSTLLAPESPDQLGLKKRRGKPS